MDESRLFDMAAVESELLKTQGLKVSRARSSIDEARVFSGWTVHKLEILRVFLTQYRRVAGNGTYIDGFAGQGIITVDGEQRPGSAGVALTSGAFKSLRFYERPRMANKLNAWLAETGTDRQRARCTVVAGDCNSRISADLESGVIPKDKPCFAFLDPNSTELDWTTVARLAAYKADCEPPKTCKIELWILLNTYQVLMRLLPLDGKPNTKVMNRWLGDEAGWKDLYESGASPGQYALRYTQRLMSDFGYGLAVPLLIRDPKTQKPQYHMIHASDHKAAHEFMRWAGTNAGLDDNTPQPLPGVF
jgi:three-Cys-motif partner protein